MDISAQDTLPDDAWKDSFDKLLDQRPTLRERNVIKRNVRASFNMNSSCENSYSTTESSNLGCKSQSKRSVINLSHNIHFLDPSKSREFQEGTNNKKVVSTPNKMDSTSNPFKCTLSPIGYWSLQNFNSNDNENMVKVRKVGFNAAPSPNPESKGTLNTPKAVKQTNSTSHSFGISPLALVKNKWQSKQNKKRVCFVTTDAEKKNDKTSDTFNEDVNIISFPSCRTFDLQPGKWRKSLNCLRRKHASLKENGNTFELLKKKQRGRTTSDVGRPKSLTITSCIAGNRKSTYICPNSDIIKEEEARTLESIDFKHQILQRCGQRRILTFDSTYKDEYLRNCCKIGEGAFGEVFVYAKSEIKKTVLKMIPIEGKQMVNGEIQKTFQQILPEVIISMELSALNDDSKTNATSGFVNLQRVRCVKGQYPSHLQKLWEDYDLIKGSENDHPKCFTINQIYVVLELCYGGQDLEGFQFKNAEQSFSVLQQVILTLAVAEKKYQFEHRDLHWGNVLVLNSNQQFLSYNLDGNILTIPTKGVLVTIIDYTLSRMTLNEYCFYNDLSNDEDLFTATGDYQFEIYRLMRKVVNNMWETFEPKTNIFWISYIIAKLFEGVKYKNPRSKNHLYYLQKLEQLQSTILTYESCAQCARDVFSN